MALKNIKYNVMSERRQTINIAHDRKSLLNQQYSEPAVEISQ